MAGGAEALRLWQPVSEGQSPRKAALCRPLHNGSLKLSPPRLTPCQPL
jgi:hypothetical protein